AAGTRTVTPRAVAPLKFGPKIPTVSLVSLTAGISAASRSAMARSASNPEAYVVSTRHSVAFIIATIPVRAMARSAASAREPAPAFRASEKGSLCQLTGDSASPATPRPSAIPVQAAVGHDDALFQVRNPLRRSPARR